MSTIIPDQQPPSRPPTSSGSPTARHCWQRPGRPCTIAGVPGDHLGPLAARRAPRPRSRREDLAAVVAGLEVIAAHVIIRDGAR